MRNVIKHGTFSLLPGKPVPFGATVIADTGVNFSVFSHNATNCELVLFRRKEKKPYAVIPFPDEYKIGSVFNMIVCDLDYENIEYGYKMDGPFSPREGHWFNPSKILLDPYAKLIMGREVWGIEPDWSDPYQYRAQIAADDIYDWEGVMKPKIPMSDLVIYEMHVRGFTRHNSSGVKNPGTYAGIIEKIPYFKKLGINCIELLPIFEFDEFFRIKGTVTTNYGAGLKNYWGYDPIGFFAPKAGYAARGAEYQGQSVEFKDMVKELHKNGIEVILDVVFNHTGENGDNGPFVSFKGIDNKTYYMVGENGKYLNFTGCHNTFNCNDPSVRGFILACLRYWVMEYHIDGFRFDLASILVRDQSGRPLDNPPIVETISYDPILSDCKLIAEAWDAAGLYQVGSFPSYGKWSDWNGKYRDDLRRFLKGDAGTTAAMAQRIKGSPDLYGHRGSSQASINFITCHDGFTLFDLVSYNNKHNEENEENNMDGTNDNNSWNWGVEGPTDNPELKRLRTRLIKNAITILLTSHGVPMLLAGDEIGRSQRGNNNAYCQDNEISWIDWNLLNDNKELFEYFRKMIAFRKAHPVLRVDNFQANSDKCYPDITLHGVEAWKPDFSHHSRTLAVMFNDKMDNDNYIYIAMNMHWVPHDFELPNLPHFKWHVFANTGAAYPEDIYDIGSERVLPVQSKISLEPRSVVVLVGKSPELNRY